MVAPSPPPEKKGSLAYSRQESEPILGTLDKGLHVLEVLAQVDTGGGFTLTELSRLIDMHPTTLFRMLATLQSRGFIARDRHTDRYRIGMRVLALAATVLRDLDIRQVARPTLEALCKSTRELVHLTVLDEGEVVTVERVDANQPLSLRNEIGSRRPAYCTASGKAILAYLPPDEAEAIMARGMPMVTPRTLTTPEALRQQMIEIRRRAFAWDDEERIEGVRCVAAPVFGMEGRIVGAVSLAAPALRTPWERLWHLGDEVRATAAEISANLGGVAAIAESAPAPG